MLQSCTYFVYEQRGFYFQIFTFQKLLRLRDLEITTVPEFVKF